MAEARPRALAMEQFLAFEAGELERYEFVGGVVRMAAGGTAAHSAIKGNVVFALDEALRRGPCRALVCDLKVLTPTAVMYPDVLVACRPLAPDDDRLSDPTAVVEVLSPASERHDLIAKWREYQRIEALRHFVVVEQRERRVEVYTRTGAGWELAIVEPPDDAAALDAIGATLSLEAIYQGSGR